ncbi:uncharacterized protein ATNIH1004_002020 [Aspergillus tanneri]|uniref:Uncharacterized protein n=1 Tax=Aspergillus tanneri TaxID=1220188 RepID=A0A5M9M2T4_9EURO|nr:uncharacterized protein ATNIH1004_002020 [Aspergillus tanneri]KAA8641352.1 hypothetical protein ATNIH1004_002020 [Aspergillus tanneri]
MDPRITDRKLPGREYRSRSGGADRRSLYGHHAPRCLPRSAVLHPGVSGMSLDLSAENISLKIPEHIRDLVRDEKIRSDAEATFNQMYKGAYRRGTFIHRITSHQDVGRRWYPEVLAWALGEYESMIA